MDLKELLGDAFKEGMTLDEVDAAIKDRKIVDLATGEYVGKGKYETAVRERDEARKQLGESTARQQEYDDLVKYRDENEAKKKAQALEESLKGYGVKPDMVEFIRFQVESGKIAGGDKLEENVKKFLQENPQYANPDNNNQNQGKQVHVNTGGNGGPNPNESGFTPAKKVVAHPWNRNR